MSTPMLLAKFTYTLRGGQVVTVFANEESGARQELEWIRTGLSDDVVDVARDDFWFTRDEEFA